MAGELTAVTAQIGSVADFASKDAGEIKKSGKVPGKPAGSASKVDTVEVSSGAGAKTGAGAAVDVAKAAEAANAARAEMMSVPVAKAMEGAAGGQSGSKVMELL